MAIRRKLDPVRKPGRKIVHQHDRRIAAPAADIPGRNEFRISIGRNPKPRIAGIWRGILRRGDVLLLSVHESPQLIDLDALGIEVAIVRVVFYQLAGLVEGRGLNE